MNNPAPSAREKLYEGKAKIVYAGPEKGTVIQYFKDDATAFNAEKRGTVTQKGIVNNIISCFLFGKLTDAGVKTHFIERLSAREQLNVAVEIVPIEVIVRNIATGSLVKKFGAIEGKEINPPMIDLTLKNDAYGDPVISDEHVRVLGLASSQELQVLKDTALRVNEILKAVYDEIGITLVDFKLEFGRGPDGVILADEISPDTCRLWDQETGKKLDKDRFRQDLGGVAEAYYEVGKRLGLWDDIQSGMSEE